MGGKFLVVEWLLLLKFKDEIRITFVNKIYAVITYDDVEVSQVTGCNL